MSARCAVAVVWHCAPRVGTRCQGAPGRLPSRACEARAFGYGRGTRCQPRPARAQSRPLRARRPIGATAGAGEGPASPGGRESS
eukprot:6660410-Prymnesium_polylepis.1